MKKIIFLIPLLAIISLATVFSANAQEAASAPEITTKDLGVENPGILPTSPFYFLKEWRRGINKFFTFNPVKKAELELEEINQRAAEMKKMEEIAPSNIEAITKAAANYQRNVERLKNRLEGLKETSQNPNIDKLLDKLVERSLQHQQLFDNLKTKFEEKTELKEQLKAGQEKIDELITKIPEKFEDVDRFKQRLEKMIENRPEGIFKELRAVEMLDRIKEKLPGDQIRRKTGEKPCTQETKICPDGSSVGRIGPNCEFAPCPVPTTCIQVITPAVSPEGICQEFPTPCDVLEGWKKVEKCPASQ